MSTSAALHQALDGIIDRIDAHRNEPLFSTEVARRNASRPMLLDTDNDVLEALSVIVAYSQNARSDLVEQMLKTGAWRSALCEFDVKTLSEVNPCKIVEDYWPHIGCIRQKTKIFQMVMAARAIRAHGGIAQVIMDADIPADLKTKADVAAFWRGFGLLKQSLKAFDIPFLSSTTSLLHLLLYMGYDCAKPDTIVMQVAKKLGIVTEVEGNAQLLHTVRVLQEYAQAKAIRTAVVDLYLLIEGGQTWARKHVTMDFYTPTTSVVTV